MADTSSWTPTARRGLLVAALLLGTLLASCSNDTKAFCDQYQAVNSAVGEVQTAIGNKDPQATKAAAQKAKQEFDKLPSAAKDQVSSQAEALKVSLETLQAAVEGALKTSDPAANLGPVTTALTGVQAAASSLKSAASC